MEKEVEKFSKEKLSEKVIEVMKQHTHPEDLLNLYLVGSYLFKTNNKNSDFDFTLIIKGEYFNGRKTYDDGLYNINMYHEEYFKLLIQEQAVDALLVLWIPSEFIIFEKLDFKNLFRLNTRKLHQQFIHEASLNWNKAKQFFFKNRKMSLKYIGHCFRKLLFSIDIWKNKKILDYEIGNKYWNTLFNNQFDSWKEIEKMFYEEFSDLVHSMKDYKYPIVKDINLKSLNELIAIHGLDYLTENYSLDYVENDFVYFVLDEFNVANENKIKKFSQGKVLKDSKLLFSYPNFINEIPKNFNIKESIIYEYLDGVNIGMFYFNDKWNIAFPKQISFREYYSENVKELNCDYSIISKFNFPVEESFWKIWKQKKYKFPTNTNLELIFNLSLTNENHISIQIKDNLILIYAYDRGLKKSLDIFEIASFYQWGLPKRYYFDCKDQLLDFIRNSDPLTHKGLYLFYNNKIVQIASSQFLNLEILKYQLHYDPNTIRKAILDISRLNGNLEFLNLETFIPFKKKFDECNSELNEFISFLEKIYLGISNLDYVDFAKEAQKYPFIFPLIQIRKYKGNTKEFVKCCPIQKLISTMKIVKEYQIEKKYLFQIGYTSRETLKRFDDEKFDNDLFSVAEDEVEVNIYDTVSRFIVSNEFKKYRAHKAELEKELGL
eukprot:gene3747-6635_t